jgi:hypothetical protein
MTSAFINRALLVALVTLGTSLPGPAWAYVRTVTRARGVPTAWKTTCVNMEFSLGAFPLNLDAAGYLNAAQQAGDAWTNASLDGVNRCSNVLFSVESVPDVAGLVGQDGHNRLIFRQDKWCRDPPPKDPKEPPCYDRNALAVTTVFQLKSSGEILDADLEVNAVNFHWGDFVAYPEQFDSSTHDFQGAITHELGHVIGLEHTCYLPSTYADGTPVPRPVDNLENPVPNCGSDNPPSITDATMYVSVGSLVSEVGLRSLSPDDAQGACDVYPVSADFVCLAPSTPATSGGGCSFPPSGRGGAIAGVLVLLLAVTRLRRRH